jgi:hypothetical protein
VAVSNLRWLSTQLRWAATGTTVSACGNRHGREHVARQLKGANLTSFFSKNTPKLPFLAEEAQMNFF